MPAYALAAGDKIRVMLVGRYLQQTIMYTFTYNVGTLVGGSDGPASIRSLMSVFQSEVWTNVLKPACVAGFTADYIQGQRAYPTKEVYERISVSEVGTYAGDNDLPSNVAATVARSGSVAGRGKNSSLHLSGLSADMLEGGVWTDAAKTLFDAVGNKLAVDLVAPVTTGSTFNPIIWTPADLTATNVIRSAAANPYPRTMRRRTVQLGI